MPTFKHYLSPCLFESSASISQGDIYIVQVTENTIKIRWGQNTNPNTQAYNVIIKLPAAVSITDQVQYGLDEKLEHTFAGLTSGTQYEILVEVILQGGGRPRNSILKYTSK